MQTVYLVIDLKTFYASVECVERGLNPFNTNLVVADPSRGKGGICLAISPKMKMLGVKNRCRIYEIPKDIKYITALPRMSLYEKYSANIYEIYLKYVSKEDIHVYSIDEAFLDITKYMKLYNMKSIGIAKMIIKDIYDTFGITATCGIGTNMYLAKIALDIMSKHSTTNIGWLDEEKYKKELWHHKPLSDFWQIGSGIERRLNKKLIFDMYDVAHTNPQILYKEFGINAELLIDHAWGRESCTIADIKSYKPKSNSISNSQVLFRDYNYDEAKLILKEMVELLTQELIEKNLETDCISLYIGYSKDFNAHSGGSRRLHFYTYSYKFLISEFIKLYEEKTLKNVPIRRIGISFGRVQEHNTEQLNLFETLENKTKESKLTKSIIQIKSKLGRNSIIKAMDLQEAATTQIRNKLIGGHNGY